MSKDKKEDVNIEQIYGSLCKLPKEEFIKNFKLSETGLTNESAKKKLDENGYNEITQSKQKSGIITC